ncbi:CHASE3 domain-containing protein [Plastorhodobacter daqingensis]|uniref:histidine kinase n=1 Tax=Plastorhodobacter daqingensis TaxID=1387281 RepID=A0ABW2UKT1_9RHOB
MPLSSPAFVRSSLVMLLLGAAILLAIVASTIVLADRSNALFINIMEERQIRRGSVDLLSALQDAETGQRGYLITADPDFLEPYDRALQRVDALQGNLAASLQDRPVRLALLPELQQNIDLKLEELAHTVALTRAGELEAARDVVLSREGQVPMDRIRAILGQYVDISDGQIESEVDQHMKTSAQLRVFAALSGLAMILVVGGAIFLISRHIRDINAAQAEVKALAGSLEERVNERTEDLMRANQEIQRFAYIVTHDLRAPLVNVMGFTSELETSLKALQAYVLADDKPLGEQEILDARAAAEEDLPEAIDFIRSSTRKMDSLINAILKISRDGRRQLRPERLDLRELIEHTADTVQHQVAESGGEVEISVDVPPVVSDRLSVEQILGNLFDNAVKYSHPERALRLRIRARSEGLRMVRIEVEDNGRGIALEDHERIFELFRRSGQQDKTGEGIGLAHVRSLARNLGGEITVSSKLGEGATFILRLPVDLAHIMRKMQR